MPAREGSPRPTPAAAAETVVRFWGVRGSLPVPGPKTLRYGGNTACVEVRTGRETIILDAGTGLRELGQDLVRHPRGPRNRLWILLSHTHWDHIQGFPFFAPAHQARQRIHILGQRGSRSNLRKTIAAAVESPFFPIPLSGMPGHLSFRELASQTSFRLGAVRATTAPLQHPGGGLAFRLATPQGVVAYVTDHEAACPEAARTSLPTAARERPQPELGVAMARLIEGADVLIHDAQYTAAEYASHQGWGHSCVEAVVGVAVRARVGHLLLFHHDPDREDRQLDVMVRDARRRARQLGGALRVDAAREGLELRLGRNQSSSTATAAA